MRVTEFDVDAKRLGVTIEQIKESFEVELSNGKILGVIVPTKTQLLSYTPDELETLIAEIRRGKISLSYLAEQLNLNPYQVYVILKHLLKTGKLNGELTYNTFTSEDASKKAMLQKAKAHKREHRLSASQKRKR